MSRSIFICASLLVGSWAPIVHAQDIRAPRTLTRTVDTVVVPGQALGPRLRVDREQVRVYACRRGFMVPVLFQVDERDPSGTYCYDQGVTDRRIQDVDRGRIDANDELVVLAREAGDRAHAATLRTIPGFADVQEVELRDPLDERRRAWIYVYSFEERPPPRVDRDLARLEIRRHPDDPTALVHVWRGEHFQIDNARSPTNAARATHAAFLGVDESPDGRPSVLDCTMARGEASFMWVTVVRHSPEIELRTGAFIDGPIRVVVESRIRVYLAAGMWVSAPDSHLILWPDRISMPTNVSCPVNLDESDVSSYRLSFDMARRSRGWQFYNSHNRTPVAIDGRMSDAERALDLTYPDWNCVFGPEGAIISKFVVPPSLQRTSNALHYLDDLRTFHDEVEGMEFEPGAMGTNGYYVDLRGIAEGLYPGDYVVWYLPAPFAPGDEVKYLNEYDHPIEARATDVSLNGGG